MHVRFGKYRVIAELGQGGMADVFLTIAAGPQGSGFSKLAVVKRVRESLAEDPECVSMLVDEARISARLNHPNVVQTLEVGTEGAAYFIAMEYLDGQPLHRLQRRAARDGAPLTRDSQVAALVAVLGGLHHAHELADYDGTPLEIVHRDVTPHNVFITYDGQVKVVDFGIAKAARRGAETRQGIVKGKVRYMAPEQAMGHAVDRRADLFAVGVMLWEAATGQRFWADQEELQIVRALVEGTFERSARAVAPDVPEALDRVIWRALDPNPDGRQANALDMRAELEEYLGTRILEAQRELGVRAAQLFAPDRAKLKTLIGEAGRLATSETFAVAADTRGRASAADSTAPFVVDGTEVMPSAPVHVVDEAVAAAAPPARARRSLRFAGIASAAGALAGALVIAFAAVHATWNREATPPIAAAAAPSATTTVDPAPSGTPVAADDADVPTSPAASPAKAARVAPPPRTPRTATPKRITPTPRKPSAPPPSVSSTSAPQTSPPAAAGSNSAQKRHSRPIDTNDPWK